MVGKVIQLHRTATTHLKWPPASKKLSSHWPPASLGVWDLRLHQTQQVVSNSGTKSKNNKVEASSQAWELECLYDDDWTV